MQQKTKHEAGHAQALRAAGHKATTARVAILHVLEQAERPLSTRTIYKAIRPKVGTDQATIYRSLESLEESGLVRQVDLRHGHLHYELAPQDDHHHLVCVHCGKVEDFEGCGVNEVIKKTLRRSKQFASVREHSFELFGTCNTCARKGHAK